MIHLMKKESTNAIFIMMPWKQIWDEAKVILGEVELEGTAVTWGLDETPGRFHCMNFLFIDKFSHALIQLNMRNKMTYVILLVLQVLHAIKYHSRTVEFQKPQFDPNDVSGKRKLPQAEACASLHENLLHSLVLLIMWNKLFM